MSSTPANRYFRNGAARAAAYAEPGTDPKGTTAATVLESSRAPVPEVLQIPWHDITDGDDTPAAETPADTASTSTGSGTDPGAGDRPGQSHDTVSGLDELLMLGAGVDRPARRGLPVVRLGADPRVVADELAGLPIRDLTADDLVGPIEVIDLLDPRDDHDLDTPATSSTSDQSGEHGHDSSAAAHDSSAAAVSMRVVTPLAPAGARPTPAATQQPTAARPAIAPVAASRRGSTVVTMIVGWWRSLTQLFQRPNAAKRQLPSSATGVDVARLQATWMTTPRDVAVLNGKGGSGKTVATAMLAAALGQSRCPVVMWEATEVAGNLADRCLPGGTGWAGLLASAAPQSLHEAGQFLASQDSRAMVLASPQDRGPLDAAAADDARRMLARFFTLLVADTGNNTVHEVWRTAADAAAVTVVPCRPTMDSIAGAQRVLERVDPARAVVVVTDTGEGDPHDVPRLLARAGVAAGAVLVVPLDPHIAEGGAIRWWATSPASRQAWTAVATAVMARLENTK